MNEEETIKNNDIDANEDTDDVVFDDIGEDGDELNETPAHLIKRFRDKIKKLEKEKEEYLTGWQKERAESVNISKRAEDEKRSFAKYANENLINDILPTIDSFDLAFKNKEAWDSLPSVWTKGIEYIYNQLLSTLESYGVKKVDPKGLVFDPTRDDALETLETEKEDEDHKILEVIQPGYMINEKVLRPAKVKIGEYKK